MFIFLEQILQIDFPIINITKDEFTIENEVKYKVLRILFKLQNHMIHMYQK